MEKLQNALEKARAQRQSGETAETAPAQRPPRQTTTPAEPAAAPLPAAEAWAALTPLEVDPELMKRNRIFSLNPGRHSTEFDILRTKIQLMMRKNGWTRLAVTSPSPACGKTTTSCNLAAGFSRQADLRTVLIELDLHRPTISKVFGFTPASDVTSVLSGKTPFAEQAVRLRDNVAISAAKRASGDPTALLLNRRTHDILADIEKTYAPDVVIFDLPPLLTSDDTRAFLNDVDCALLVVRAEATTLSQIDLCEREIAEHTNFLGVVLNQCRHAEPEHGYGYGSYGGYAPTGSGAARD